MTMAEKTVPKQLEPYAFKPGESGNPAGRPKGSISIKDEVRKHLEANPEAVKEIVEHFVEKNRELMWQMLEGRPPGDDKLAVQGDVVISFDNAFAPTPEDDSK